MDSEETFKQLEMQKLYMELELALQVVKDLEFKIYMYKKILYPEQRR